MNKTTDRSALIAELTKRGNDVDEFTLGVPAELLAVAVITEQTAIIEGVRGDIAKVIADLDRARANGTTYTYGNIQERLRHTAAILSDAVAISS